MRGAWYAYTVAVGRACAYGEGVCSDVACRVANKGAASRLMVTASRLTMPRRLRGFRRGLISGCGRHLDHDAARRVATFIEERENRF